MRVEIVDISNKSAHFEDRNMYIGKTATIATEYVWRNGFSGCTVYLDSGQKIYVHEIKTKPIYDA